MAMRLMEVNVSFVNIYYMKNSDESEPAASLLYIGKFAILFWSNWQQQNFNPF